MTTKTHQRWKLPEKTDGKLKSVIWCMKTDRCFRSFVRSFVRTFSHFYWFVRTTLYGNVCICGVVYRVHVQHAHKFIIHRIRRTASCSYFKIISIVSDAFGHIFGGLFVESCSCVHCTDNTFHFWRYPFPVRYFSIVILIVRLICGILYRFGRAKRRRRHHQIVSLQISLRNDVNGNANDCELFVYSWEWLNSNRSNNKRTLQTLYRMKYSTIDISRLLGNNIKS